MKNYNKNGRTPRDAKRFVDIGMSRIEQEKRAKQRYEEYQNNLQSPEFQRQRKLDQMTQKVDVQTSEAIEIVARGTEELANDILDLIKSELNLKETRKFESYHKDITTADMEQIINECLPALKKLRVLSENKKIKNKAMGRIYNVYEQLFNNLIPLDARFAIFAPKSILTRHAVMEKIDMLPEEIKHDVVVSQKEKGDYVSNHLVCDFEFDNERVEATQRILKKVESSEKLSVSKMIEATEGLAKDIFTLTAEEIERLKQENENINFKQIYEVFSSSIAQRMQLIKLMNNEHIIANGGFKKSPHKKLLQAIIVVNGNFLISILEEYSKRLTSTEAKKQLRSDEKQDLYEIIVENNMLNNPKHKFIQDRYKDLIAEISKDSAVSI